MTVALKLAVVELLPVVSVSRNVRLEAVRKATHSGQSDS